MVADADSDRAAVATSFNYDRGGTTGRSLSMEAAWLNIGQTRAEVIRSMRAHMRSCLQARSR